jgi:DNA-binding PadR family transcriptional regulator
VTATRSPFLPRNTQQQQTRSAWLLRALAQNPEPLSTPALASLLAEPGRRRRLLASCDHTLRQHEQAGHIERAGRERKGHGRPAIIWRITSAGRRWPRDHDKAPVLAAATAVEAQRKTEQAKRRAAERDEALDEARAIFTRQTPRISRKRAAHQIRELGCTLDQIGAVFHVSKERIRQDLLWDPPVRSAARKLLKYLSRASAPEAERAGPGRRAGSAQLPWRLRRGCPGWS